MNRSASPEEPYLEQAAEWIVALSADDPNEREQARADFEAWKRADPRHASAAASLESVLGHVSGARAGTAGSGRPGRSALDAAYHAAHHAAHIGARRKHRLKRAGTVLALACALALPAWLAFHTWPPAYLLADIRTASGEWQTQTLSDGSRITLRGGSAVNLRYDAARRVVELVQGEILVEVARDASRPFVVETADGSMRALGTRFVVDRETDATVLDVIESKVLAQTPQRQAGERESTVVHAGQRVRMTPNGISPTESIDARSLDDAWRHHQLVVEDRPLADTLDELARNRRGALYFDRAALAGIRVTAVLPLDDTDRALQLLAINYPALRIRTLTPYLVYVDMPGASTR